MICFNNQKCFLNQKRVNDMTLYFSIFSFNSYLEYRAATIVFHSVLSVTILRASYQVLSSLNSLQVFLSPWGFYCKASFSMAPSGFLKVCPILFPFTFPDHLTLQMAYNHHFIFFMETLSEIGTTYLHKNVELMFNKKPVDQINKTDIKYISLSNTSDINHSFLNSCRIMSLDILTCVPMFRSYCPKV